MIKVQDGAGLSKALEMARRIIEKGDYFPYNCAHLSSDGSFLIVEATDKYRLYRYILPAEGDPLDVFIPHISIFEIARIIGGEVIIEMRDKFATFSSSGAKYTVLSADTTEEGKARQTYPTLDYLIADLENGAYRGVVDAKEFQKALVVCKRVAGAKGYYRVTLEADGQMLRISAKKGEQIIQRDIHSTLFLPRGVDYNAKYLLDAIPDDAGEVELLYEGKKGMLLGVYGDGGKSVIARMLPPADDLTH